ncbi:FGGY-family carbohydrate kinase [Phenylobacterium sp.]|uniref:FGGY-family carbohydrate kinase n=1 Tax=Phenylobacterium sp. TaxID=1871053 RepID=UPI003567C9E0
MEDGLTVVLDVGKTLAKLSLWDQSGTVIARETRPNKPFDAGAYAALDAAGIEAWAAEVLRDFAGRGPVTAIVPVAHGAALAVLRDGRLACPPPDYEEPVPEAVRDRYELDRDAFDLTGSPRLPLGLNLGVQLAWLEVLYPGLLDPGATVVTWAQYWAWVFSGVAATEVTSLGCHTDLWRPRDAVFSAMAVRRGWAERLAPLRRADEALGQLRPDWVARTGLSAETKVYCGLHDSNAALLAARGFAEISNQESTVLSTGTWFVAMRSPARPSDVDISALAETRDCLVNVDAYGAPIPSARFMGGREVEILSGIDTRRIDIKLDQARLLAAVPAVLADGARALPTFTPGVGPFPQGAGRWIDMPTDPIARRAGVALYAALVADASLDLIGACERIVIEGRFAEAEVFVRALASLRPRDRIYVSNAEHDVSCGALRLLTPSLRALSSLTPVEPLAQDLQAYAGQWRRDAARIEAAGATGI